MTKIIPTTRAIIPTTKRTIPIIIPLNGVRSTWLFSPTNRNGM
jgi:hypothetical protein